MNFRADRARQLTQAFVDTAFAGFAPARKIHLSAFVTLTEYSADLPVTGIAYAAQSLHNSLGEYSGRTRHAAVAHRRNREVRARDIFFFSRRPRAAVCG